MIGWERIGEYGELRSFLRDGPPPQMAFEILREVDGRAWTLRVPLEARPALAGLVRQAANRLARPEQWQFDAAGLCPLASARLDAASELAALVLQEDGELRFALWRRELLGGRWEWTLDALFVPAELGQACCVLVESALARVEAGGGAQ